MLLSYSAALRASVALATACSSRLVAATGADCASTARTNLCTVVSRGRKCTWGATAPGVTHPRWPHERPAGFPLWGFPLWGVHDGHLERVAVRKVNLSHLPVDHLHHLDVNAVRRWHGRKVAGAAPHREGSAHWHHPHWGRTVLASRHQTLVPPHGCRKVPRPRAWRREVCLRARQLARAHTLGSKTISPRRGGTGPRAHLRRARPRHRQPPGCTPRWPPARTSAGPPAYARKKNDRTMGGTQSSVSSEEGSVDIRHS